jgi:hypothetical protein
MRRRHTIADLRERAYWTVGQAARVLGHNAAYWRVAFDEHDVEGHYSERAGRRTRYIDAGSARAYLKCLDDARIPRPATRRESRESMRALWARADRMEDAGHDSPDVLDNHAVTMPALAGKRNG